MLAIELLHKFTPDAERIAVAKVAPAEHLSYAERLDVERISREIEKCGNMLTARSMQHLGPVGDALDLAATVASAGEACCQFVLNRALMNPHELTAAKVAISECALAASNMLTLLESDEQRASVFGQKAAEEFMEWAPERFVPLFEDLEAHARKRFPHLAVNDQPKEGKHV